MSKMTSSIYNNDDHNLASGRRQQAAVADQTHSLSQFNKQQPQNDNNKIAACNGTTSATTKVLTNFSIDSIIGGNSAKRSERASGVNERETAPAGAACNTLPERQRPVGEFERTAEEIVEGASVRQDQNAPENCKNCNQIDTTDGKNQLDTSDCPQIQLLDNTMDHAHHAKPQYRTNSTSESNSEDSNKTMIDIDAHAMGNQNNCAVIRQSQPRPKVFRCAWCPLAFSNNGQLRNHERIHTGERPFRCEQIDCGKTFTRNEELTRHKLIHTGARPHACSRCDKSFGRKDHLKKHERTHERKRVSKRAYGQRANTIANQVQQMQCQQSHLSPTQFIGSHHELDLFQPLKPTDYHHHLTSPMAEQQQLNAAMSHYLELQPHNPATSQPVHLQHCSTPPIASISQANLIPNGLLTNQLASLAAAVAATTSTATATSLSTALHPFSSAPSLTTTQAMTSAAAVTAASNPMQQLASDYYWQWWSLLNQQNDQTNY